MGVDAFSISFIFEAILLSSILVAGLAWISIRVARRIGLVDLPDREPHKLHIIPTPLAGGLALFGGLLISAWIFGTIRDPSVVAVFAAGSIVFLFGLWDDFKGISPLMKIIGQTLAVIILINSGVSIKVFESPEFFLGGSDPINLYIDWLFTFLWVVGITNAFNFVDSMDGLSVGLGGMAAAFFMLVTMDAGQLLLSSQSALILGTCIGLYFFNSPPAHLFLGDSGAQTLGFVLAVLAIAYQPQGANQSSSWVVPIMLLGVPIFDMALVVVSRLRRGKPIYAAARDHTFHRLLALGWTSNRAVLAMQVVSLLLGCLAFVVLTRPPILANGIFAAVLLAGALILTYLDSRARWS
ncbi:MAG TPA: MraY family glycosyltransferase [Anaerolineales bacterium]|nr:MraY family glycosyltransferase [Anaerolineales bacterium]